jgi:hypothetical protein
MCHFAGASNRMEGTQRTAATLILGQWAVASTILLYSFTYEESTEAFRDAAARDPQRAMTHWNSAMTEYHQF